MAENIERQVIEIIARKKKLAADAVTIDSTFSALGIDSLDAADLLFAVEDAFGILVPDAAAQSMRTVGEVVEGVRRLLAERPSVV